MCVFDSPDVPKPKDPPAARKEPVTMAGSGESQKRRAYARAGGGSTLLSQPLGNATTAKTKLGGAS